MLKKNYFFALCLSALFTCSSFASAQNDKVTPFTDNVTVNLSQFAAGTAFRASYQNDNDVNISGPTNINDTHFQVKINSQNRIENGFPNLTLYYHTPSGDQQCTMNFIDGPWTMLAYRYKNPPLCPGVTVSPMIMENHYQYVINITKVSSHI